ncbi:MAG: hypothetical protein JWO42_1758 [Chloroflexi bacterium]|jgi:hypothetical protein|nr:hypothetical protein [Chloroflexota bacterium]
MVDAGNKAETIVTGNAWCRELHRVLVLSDQRQAHVDRETLIHSDVRDLQRLVTHLQSRARWLDRLRPARIQI